MQRVDLEECVETMEPAAPSTLQYTAASTLQVRTYEPCSTVSTESPTLRVRPTAAPGLSYPTAAHGHFTPPLPPARPTFAPAAAVPPLPKRQLPKPMARTADDADDRGVGTKQAKTSLRDDVYTPSRIRTETCMEESEAASNRAEEVAAVMCKMEEDAADLHRQVQELATAKCEAEKETAAAKQKVQELATAKCEAEKEAAAAKQKAADAAAEMRQTVAGVAFATRQSQLRAEQDIAAAEQTRAEAAAEMQRAVETDAAAEQARAEAAAETKRAKEAAAAAEQARAEAAAETKRAEESAAAALHRGEESALETEQAREAITVKDVALEDCVKAERRAAAAKQAAAQAECARLQAEE